MTHREKIAEILGRIHTGSAGLWLGQPVPETERIYLERSGCRDMDELRVRLGDDCRWLPADGAYRHPGGLPAFPDISLRKDKGSAAGIFAECDSVADVAKYPWPDPDFCNFADIAAAVRSRADLAVFSGFWSCFFHITADFFGMENYFVKMYTDPDVVHAVTGRVADFYAECGDRFLDHIGGDLDTVFMGNDFGTQRALLISPEMFRTFVLPTYRRLITIAKKHGKKVILHSCGSILPIIPDLIDAGADALHPLQALAAGMDAASLAREFG